MKFFTLNLHALLLTLTLSSYVYADCSYELFSISSTKETRIVDFVDQLSDECEFSVIVTDPHAQQMLNAKLNKTHLKNLTIEEVLDIVLKENNLSYQLQNNILKISYLNTKVFGIDYILSQRKGKGSTDITLSSSSSNKTTNGTSSGTQASSNSSSSNSSRGNSSTSGSNASAQSGISIESTDEVKFWEELDLELQKVINTPQDTYQAKPPIINKNAGLITVTATVKQLERLEKYLKKLQDKVKLQVLIDVQLLAVTMSKGKTTGIDWQQLYALQNGTVELGTGTGTVTDSGGTSYNPTDYVTIKAGGTLNQVVKFLKTQGDVSSISNPKVLTLNNQPALITVGTEYFYKIQQTTNQQGSSGGVAATTQNDSVQSVFAGVLLDITPEISDDHTITLKINPSLSETRTDMTQTDSASRTMPPDLNRRQLSSVVTVKDGNKIILGGLINTSTIKSSNQVPILGSIPGLSYLFKYEENVKQVQELVIVIEPHIIHKEKNDLSLSDLGYEGLNDKLIQLNPSKNDANSSQSQSQENKEDEL